MPPLFIDMIKTYTVPHALELGSFFDANKSLMNSLLDDCWAQIQWRVKRLPHPNGTSVPMKQVRRLPTLPPPALKRQLRRKYIRGWVYSSHWIDGAIKIVWGMLKSWKKNYINGTRKAVKPVVRRPFVRVQSMLYRWDGRGLLRISIKPYEFVYVDVSKRYFTVTSDLGEPVLSPSQIHLPFHFPDPAASEISIGWDSNLNSLDGFSPQTGWLRVDLKPLQTLHTCYHEKYKRLNRVFAKQRAKGRRLYAKYRRRERHRVVNYLHSVVNGVLAQVPARHGFEDLTTEKLFRKRHRLWNQRIADTDWRKTAAFFKTKCTTVEVSPYNTSKTCARCGHLHQGLRGERVFVCPRCGVCLDRQLNAAINIYLKMNGDSHDPPWIDGWVRGGLPAIGAGAT